MHKNIALIARVHFYYLFKTSNLEIDDILYYHSCCLLLFECLCSKTDASICSLWITYTRAASWALGYSESNSNVPWILSGSLQIFNMSVSANMSVDKYISFWLVFQTRVTINQDEKLKLQCYTILIVSIIKNWTDIFPQQPLYRGKILPSDLFLAEIQVHVWFLS